MSAGSWVRTSALLLIAALLGAGVGLLIVWLSTFGAAAAEIASIGVGIGVGIELAGFHYRRRREIARVAELAVQAEQLRPHWPDPPAGVQRPGSETDR